MGIINSQNLKDDIKNNNFSKVYYIYGSEKYLISYYSSILCEAVHKNIFTEFNFHKFNEHASVQQIASAVEALPMMSEMKCVLVDDWNLQNINQSEYDRLTELILNLPSSCVLIFKNTRELKKLPAVRKALKLFEKNGSVLEFKKMSTADISKQLVRWAKTRDCNLNLNNAQFLIEHSTNDLLSLKNELEKLCAYCKNKKTIEKQDIEEIVTKSIDSSVFTMSNAVCSGNFDLAFDELDKLIFQKEEPIMILAVLASSFIDMFRIKMIDKYKKNDNLIAENFDYGNKTFRLKMARKNATKFSTNDIKKIINLFSETDIKLKSEKGEGRVYIEKLLAQIILILNLSIKKRKNDD